MYKITGNKVRLSNIAMVGHNSFTTLKVNKHIKNNHNFNNLLLDMRYKKDANCNINNLKCEVGETQEFYCS